MSQSQSVMERAKFVEALQRSIEQTLKQQGDPSLQQVKIQGPTEQSGRTHWFDVQAQNETYRIRVEPLSQYRTDQSHQAQELQRQQQQSQSSSF